VEMSEFAEGSSADKWEEDDEGSRHEAISDTIECSR